MASRKRSRRPVEDRRRTSSAPKAQQTSPAPESELPRLGEMLGRFSDALDLLKTTHRALLMALQEDTPIGPEVTTLDRGIQELVSVYGEFDLTFLNRRSHGETP